MTRPAQPLVLYRHPLSGHCHRVELLLALLDLPVHAIDVDLAAGAHRAPAFLAMNAFGQVPVLRDGEHLLADSNAILVYLARAYGDGAWLPSTPLGLARVQRWLSVAAGPLAHGPAAARRSTVFGRVAADDTLLVQSHALLAVMDRELARAPWLAGEQPSIADLANYAYVAHAPEGGVDLGDYPHVRGWLARIEAMPRFVPMRASKAGLVA